MGGRKQQAVRVVGRQALKEHLAAQHRKDACSRDPEAQLARGGWGRKEAGRVDLFGGAAILRWKYTCPTCKVVALVEIE